MTYRGRVRPPFPALLATVATTGLAAALLAPLAPATGASSASTSSSAAAAALLSACGGSSSPKAAAGAASSEPVTIRTCVYAKNHASSPLFWQKFAPKNWTEPARTSSRTRSRLPPM